MSQVGQVGQVRSRASGASEGPNYEERSGAIGASEASGRGPLIPPTPRLFFAFRVYRRGVNRFSLKGKETRQLGNPFTRTILIFLLLNEPQILGGIFNFFCMEGVTNQYCRPMINKNPFFKGLNIKIPITISSKGRGFTNQGFGLP